jgi:type IV pilus assembly protein PilZ
VVWINPYKEGEKNINPGMGVKFIDLTPELRERLIEIVRKIAYLKDKEHS